MRKENQNVNKDIEIIKKNQIEIVELRYKINWKKITIGIQQTWPSRSKKEISELKDRSFKMIKSKEKKNEKKWREPEVDIGHNQVH